MSRSSLGFHTLTLSSWLTDTDELLKDFTEYSHKNKNLKIYPDKNGNTIISFYKKDQGIEWKIHYNVWQEDSKLFLDFLYVTINPKILAGITDYITAATLGDMNVAIANFNSISKSISPLLVPFDQYTITRIDYCLNLSLNELASECSPELMMNLIKRSNIPPTYHEWMKYDEVSHRMKSRPGSFYLINGSTHINCYSKFMQLTDRSEKNIAHGYPPIDPEILAAAYDIIRFEVQCKYRKSYFLSKKANYAGNRNINKYKDLLAPAFCQEIIHHYFNKTIGRGHWYAFQQAANIIKSKNFNTQKETRLISALQEVNQCRSIAKAKAAHQDRDLEAFNRTLHDLTSIGINPVTIPRDWGINRIGNLLDSYHVVASSNL